MDKNRIEGCYGAMSEHNITKPSGMLVEVNAAAVQRSNVSLPGEVCAGKPVQESGEAIVIEETSRSASVHSKFAGGLTR